MELEFATSRLERASQSLALAERTFGVPIGRKYIQRMAVLSAVEEFGQLHGIVALRIHELKGDRASRHALTLTGNFRLVIERMRKDRVRILSVEDYHGD